MNLVKKTTIGYLFFLISICMLILAGCEGPAGPQGAEGPEGPEGPQGPAGEDANVTLYIFDAPDFTSSDPDHTFIIENITEEEVQSSQWEFAFIRGIYTQRVYRLNLQSYSRLY